MLPASIQLHLLLHRAPLQSAGSSLPETLSPDSFCPSSPLPPSSSPPIAPWEQEAWPPPPPLKTGEDSRIAFSCAPLRVWPLSGKRRNKVRKEWAKKLERTSRTFSSHSVYLVMSGYMFTGLWDCLKVNHLLLQSIQWSSELLLVAKRRITSNQRSICVYWKHHSWARRQLLDNNSRYLQIIIHHYTVTLLWSVKMFVHLEVWGW